jgi:hypothetical protein
MKKEFLLVAVLFTALLLQAKEVTVVLRGIKPNNPGHTEVTTKGTNFSDTLTVVPGKDVENIYITLRDGEGHVQEHYCVPAGWEDLLRVITPSFPDSYSLEIRDDQGVVYTEEED